MRSRANASCSRLLLLLGLPVGEARLDEEQHEAGEEEELVRLARDALDALVEVAFLEARERLHDGLDLEPARIGIEVMVLAAGRLGQLFQRVLVEVRRDVRRRARRELPAGELA